MNTEFNVVGLLAMIFALVGLIVLPLWFGLVGLVLGIVGVCLANKKKGMAIAGIAVGAVDIVWVIATASIAAS